MSETSFKKFNICGDENPYWLMVEPILFDIWADGIQKAKTSQLQGINMLSWVIGVSKFLGEVILKLAFLASMLFICYSIFPETLSKSFDLIFSRMYMGSDLWAYQLLGYAIIVLSALFIFGNSFKEFVLDSCLNLFLLITNMLPLRYLAKGLKKESYVAQAIAKSPFMGVHIVIYAAGMHRDSVNQWDKVFNLYSNSNRPLVREELEKLAKEHAQKHQTT